MYSERSYKNYIFWMQVKRVVVIIILGCLGAALGVLITKILESTIKLTSFNNLIIGVSTTVFFLLGLLLTVGTGKQVQDGYWRIALLRKLTVIQKNLELNNELLKKADKVVKGNLVPISINEKKETSENKTSEKPELIKIDEAPENMNMKKKKKKLKNKDKKVEQVK